MHGRAQPKVGASPGAPGGGGGGGGGQTGAPAPGPAGQGGNPGGQPLLGLPTPGQPGAPCGGTPLPGFVPSGGGPADNCRSYIGPNGIPIYYLASHQVREREVKLKPWPTHNELKSWKSHLISNILSASDRTDELAATWINEIADPRVTFSDLAYVPVCASNAWTENSEPRLKHSFLRTPSSNEMSS